ncbi:AAA family ATPase [Limibacter armeniacum]|uniref:AAA family ATPase n=1 Tax=Limibacter armeniacum TaxID=466084 RepID=UPI002FE5F5D9
MDQDRIKSFKEALSASPDNEYLKVILIQELIKEAQYDEAISMLITLISKDETNWKYKLWLGKCYLEKGDVSIASVILEELLQQYSEEAEVWVLQAKLYLKEDDLVKASKAYQHAKSLNEQVSDKALEEAVKMPQHGEAVSDKSFGEEIEETILSSGKEGKVTFEHVGGMEKEKEEIRVKIIHPLKHGDLYAAYGKKIGGGILLYGPPGCGKTHLARATAGEINANFLSVGLNDILDMYIGNSERNLHRYFEEARAMAPCVLFFDEVDALGASRSDLKTSAGRNLINQFLSELDGVQTNNDGVLILGATNAPWHLDAAFRRPGRFDRIIFVSPPDAAAREDILKVSLTGKPVGDIDYGKIAKKTDNYSGADIAALIDLAVEDKIREAMKSGVPDPLSTKDLLSQLKQVKPSTKEWFVTARNYALYANESGIYDDILQYLKIKK